MASPRDHFVTLSGLRFHYLEWGDRQAPVVLLLHGLSGNAWEWQPVAERLKSRFRVLAVNQRGHGATAWADRYDVRAMAADVEELVTALGLGTIRLVGHSMGGAAGLYYTARHPASVTRLGIVDIGPCDPVSLQQTWPAVLNAFAEAGYTDPRQAVDEWKRMNPRVRDDALRHFVLHNLRRDEHGMWRWRLDAAGLVRFIRAWPGEEEMWEVVRRVNRPTRIVRGELSDMLAGGTARRMAAEMPDAELVELPGVGHDLTVEAPDRLAAAIDEFLRR